MQPSLDTANFEIQPIAELLPSAELHVLGEQVLAWREQEVNSIWSSRMGSCSARGECS